jgi:hypothetical protein
VEPIRSIAEIPFERRDPLELLNLHLDRDEPDPDYTGFGYATVDAIQLRSHRGDSRIVRNVLVVALHCTEIDPVRAPNDVELEFFIPAVSPTYSVTAPLSRFLAIWLPRILTDESAIVLALCNRHAARLPAMGDRPIHHAFGDVDSWLDEGGALTLVADEWTVAT